MSAATTDRLQNLSSDHPEWDPWLSVVGEVLNAATDRHWEDFVPAIPRQAQSVPLLAQASIVVSIDFLRRWLKQMLRTAAASGTPEMATLQAAEKSDVEAVQLFRAALAQNSRKLERIALDCGADAKAFQSVAELLPIPFLQACGRLWSNAAFESWTEGYCPLCGAWPALAEVRGIERARYLRCGRCGKEWQAHALRCLFCNTDDHEQLVSLVPQNGASARAIEGCKRCSGYLKSFTRLQGIDALEVMLDDLASVDLDIAAVEQGYRRPPGPGRVVNPTVGYSKESIRQILSWRH
jgi:FdhE protein